MKKSKFLFGALGFMALGLASCSSDDLVVEQPTATSNETRFISIQISSPNEGLNSRAPEFNQGTTAESYITRLDFLFFDVNGNPTAHPQTIGTSELTTNGTFTDGYDGSIEGGNVTRIYTSIVPVEISQGDRLPAQVLCVVNGNANAVTELQSKTLEEIRDVKQPQITRSGNFLMTNSVYYGLNVFNGEPNQRLCATPINTNTQLFASRKAAEDAVKENGDAARVNIYVERVAAKVGLTMAADAPKTYVLPNEDGSGNVTLTFVPEYWLMNATDDDAYLTKHYGVDIDGKIEMLPNYGQINKALSDAGFTGWNDPVNHRSYWGVSPSYFTNNFPTVSDQVDDLENHTYDYPVTYYSYNAIKGNLNDDEIRAVNKQGIAAVGGAFTASINGDAGYIYTRETTTPKVTINDITNGNPAAAVASAVVLGHYTVTVPGEEATVKNFYVDRNNGEKGTYYGSEAAAVKEMVTRQTVIYTDNTGSTLVSNENLFEMAHPNYATRQALGSNNIAGRLVALQLKESVTEGEAVYFFDASVGTNGSFVAVNAGNIAKANAQLISAGYMDVFANGLAFFSIPVRHSNFKDGSYNPTTHQYNWANMAVGEIGIVRNHIYNITVTGITGLGNGLRSADQPIVPSKDVNNQYIAMKLNILSWNIAKTWSVEL